MPRWVVIRTDDQQDGAQPVLRASIVIPEPGMAQIWWEAHTANEAIQSAALKIREGGSFYATNYDTLIVADDVTLEMQAIVPGIRAAGAVDE